MRKPGVEFRVGEGRISGALAMGLGAASAVGVLCFHYPEFLTTPQFRAEYSVAFLRGLLQAVIVLGFGFGMLSVMLDPRGRWGWTGLGLAIAALLAGGWRVQLPETLPSSQLTLGLDWFALDLLLLALIWIPLERWAPRVAGQFVFRPGWRVDLAYFGVSHLLVSILALLILWPASQLGRWVDGSFVASTVAGWPFVVQFVLILLVADFTQYWVHRAFHLSPFLWRFHRVHHQPTELDWLAGSRLHLLDIVVTRALTLVPLVVLGFEPTVLRAYLIFVAVWATWLHANVRTPSPVWLERWVALPRVHWWHHAAEARAVNTNYAVHWSWLDRLFGTYCDSQGRDPRRLGLSE